MTAKSILVYRGEYGLSPSLVPISPHARRSLRLGESLHEAVASAVSWGDSLCGTDLEGGATTVAQLKQLSEYNLSENPYVSTTRSLHRAFEYATPNGIDDTRGYVTVAALSDSFRYVDYSDFLKHGVAASDSEVAVLGAIFPNEICGRIPTKNLVEDFKRNRLDKMKIEEVLSLSAVFANDMLPELMCPSCGALLSPYLTEVLGYDSGMLQVYTNPYRSPYAEHRPQIAWNPSFTLAEKAKICRCLSCMKYIYNPITANAPSPLQIPIFEVLHGRLSLQLQNLASEYIDAFTIRIYATSSAGERIWSQVQHQCFNYSALHEIYNLPDFPQWDTSIPPHESVTHATSISVAEGTQIERLRVTWVHFIDGREWIPLDYYDPTYEQDRTLMSLGESS